MEKKGDGRKDAVTNKKNVNVCWRFTFGILNLISVHSWLIRDAATIIVVASRPGHIDTDR
jgi:hypothetical protein